MTGAARVSQLRSGIRGAAAALPAPHAPLGSRAMRAADALAAGTGDATPEDRLDEVVRVLEELHYRVVRAAVLDVDAQEVELAELLERAERLAEQGGENAGAAGETEANASAPGREAADPPERRPESRPDG